MYRTYRQYDREGNLTELCKHIDFKCADHTPNGFHGNHSVGVVLFLAALCEECSGDGEG